ncbi:MAG: STAS domain-containing protein [Planctomycetes bacterium]|nr:STAS domain-containing protein [Planctomycetota bacterium]
MAVPPLSSGLHAFDLESSPSPDGKGRVLLVTIRREFDFGNLHQDWAVSVVSQAPGPFVEVTLDLSQCGLVSSTFFAGLLQLRGHYCPKGSSPLRLRHPDPRVLRNLAIMRLDSLFCIEPRPKPVVV